MQYIIFWITLTLVVGWIASQRGRSAVAWILLSLLISPLVALIIVLVLPKIDTDADADLKRMMAARKMNRDPSLNPILKAQQEQQNEIDALTKKP